MEIRKAYSVEQTVYFESQTDRVLIYVEFTAVTVLKYKGILSLVPRLYSPLMQVNNFSEAGTGGPDPLENYKNNGFLIIALLVQIPWKITKLPSKHSMIGHHQHTSETPFNGVLPFNGGPMMARL